VSKIVTSGKHEGTVFGRATRVAAFSRPCESATITIRPIGQGDGRRANKGGPLLEELRSLGARPLSGWKEYWGAETRSAETPVWHREESLTDRNNSWRRTGRARQDAGWAGPAYEQGTRILQENRSLSGPAIQWECCDSQTWETVQFWTFWL